MTMRAAVYSSGMLARQRARSSVPPSLTISLARSRTYSSVSIGTPTTVTRPSSATRKSTLSRSEISSAVEAWPFGGRDTVLEALTTMPMSSNSRRRKEKALIVFVVIPARPRETPSTYAKAYTQSLSDSSLKRFSPGRKAKQNIAGPMGSPGSSPLEHGIVLGSSESIRKNTTAGRVP